MNCARFWAAVVAVYAALGLLVSLLIGATEVAVIFMLALVVAITVVHETWEPRETWEETDR